ncbi:MAG: PilZ domain-containing protein [Myxococcaceae bacterium]|nr:PilZ domain-containing protein [Myxococcaceae bacterium]
MSLSALDHSPVRQHRRFSVALEVIRTGAAPERERVANLSRGGACVVTSSSLPAGSRHTFLFVLSGRREPLVVPVRAQIAWSAHDELGLTFLGSDPRIDAYVEKIEEAKRRR